MKRLFLTSLTMAAAAMAMGAPLSPQQALQRLSATAPGSRTVSAARFTESDLLYTATDNAEATLYVFGRPGQGFVIAGGDDVAQPLLGYSESGTFDYASLPDNFRWWLSEYSREIAAAKALHRKPCVGAPRTDRAPIAPLVKTKWNQDSPYNDLCPDVRGQMTYSGCVATAMAQVMKVHNWPESGTGSYSYSWGGQQLSVDFEATHFQWDKMTDTYAKEPTGSDTEARAAVAELMYACGVSVSMNYGTGGSGAMSSAVGPALRKYFKYGESTTFLERGYFELEDWQDIIYTSLSHGNPVYYSGQNASVGHAFVCDGYSSDGYFHFNWGWGGVSDGYFQLTALDPRAQGIGGSSSGYNIFQGAIVEAMPAGADSKPLMIIISEGEFKLSNEGKEVTATGVFRYKGVGRAKIQLGLKFTAENGQEYILADPTVRNGRENFGVTSIKVDASSIPAGDYLVTAVCNTNADGETPAWHKVYAELTSPAMAAVEIDEDGTMEFFYPEFNLMDGSNLKLNSKMYNGLPCSISYTLENPNAFETYEYYYIGLLRIQGDDASLMAVSPPETIDLKSGEKRDITVSPVFNGVTGDYAIALLQPYGNNYYLVSDTVNVTINPRPVRTTYELERLQVQNPDSVNASSILFDLSLKCTEGYFATYINAAIFNSGNHLIFTQPYSYEFINAGETLNTTYTLSDPALEVGKTYKLRLYVGTSYLEGESVFTVGSSAVNTVETDRSALTLTPNPVEGEALLTAPEAIRTVEVYGMDGSRQNVTFTAEGNQARLDASRLGSGMYLVRVNGQHVLRLIRK